MNNCLRKSENLKPQWPLRALLLLHFLSRISPNKIIPERNCSKTLQKFRGNHLQWISGLETEHRPSYIQKLYCKPCWLWNFEVTTSRNIFNWFFNSPVLFTIIFQIHEEFYMFRSSFLSNIFRVISLDNKI